MRAARAFPVLAAVATVLLAGGQQGVAALVAGSSTDVLVSVGSPGNVLGRNIQNEPTVAVDPQHPEMVAAGANEIIDGTLCDTAGSCAVLPGIGTSGVYFSLTSGTSWTQPTYTGLSGHTGTAKVGPIGTVPWYYEAGLETDGDPSVAFGPRLGDNGFSWTNGSRLYYSTMASNIPGSNTIAGFEAVAVSRTDDVTGAAGGDKNAWKPPVIAAQAKHANGFTDKPGLWVDNASSSSHFGTAYTCWNAIPGPQPLQPIVVSHSTNGGDSWSAPVQVSPGAAPGIRGPLGCEIRTDSRGAVYVFWWTNVTTPSHEEMARSFDGGVTFETGHPVANVVDEGKLDPVSGVPTMDGIAGARTGSTPSVDIANGAPGGDDATNEIVLAWADARHGVNHEEALLQRSMDGGRSWSSPVSAGASGDRPDFPSVAISPSGGAVYLTYQGFRTPWQSTTTAPRLFLGVIRSAHADLTQWTTVHRGAQGDARASTFPYGVFAEFLGDYNAAATRDHAVLLWTDARNAADCPAIDRYRQSLNINNPLPPPPLSACPSTWANTDIRGSVVGSPGEATRV
jgi:hypothetical protein